MKLTLKNSKIIVAACVYTMLTAMAVPLVAPASQVGAACQTTTTRGAAGASVSPQPNPLFPSWFDGLVDSDKNVVSPRQCKTAADDTGLRTFVTIIALNIVQIMIYIVGYVSLGFIIWGGFKYIISGENANGTSAAKKTIQNAVIGLVLAIVSVAIVKFVGSAIVA